MPDSFSDPLAHRIAGALQTPPPTHIAPDFAARVAADAHARFGPIPQPLAAPQFGALAVRMALAALLLAMLVLAHDSGLSPTVSVTLQLTLAAEFVLLALYLVRPTFLFT